MLPGPVLVMLRILSWLSIPLWPAGIAAEFIFDDEGVEFLITGAALAATLAALMLHMHDRADERITNGLAAHQRSEADIALLTGAAFSSGLAAAPIQRTSGGLPVLRSVPDYPAS